jgi:hypothetical protein
VWSARGSVTLHVSCVYGPRRTLPPASAAVFVAVLVVAVFLEPSDRAVDDSCYNGCDKDE